MLARIRKAMDEREEGFTLIELLVVMIIIGILAAIAIPVFLNQRAKARDSSTKADVSTVGKEMATYYVDGTGSLTVAQTGAGTPITVGDGGTYSASIKTSSGTTLAGATPTTGMNSTNWCVGLTNPDGSSSNTWKYSATDGLKAGSC